MDGRVCKICNVFKALDEFYKDKQGKFGVTCNCKNCISLKRKNTYSASNKTEHKKQYDLERSRATYKRFKERRLSLFDKMGGCCEDCGKKAEIGFHLHHKEYHETESNYPRHSKAMNVRLKRLKEAEEHTDRFALLCESCHIKLHGYSYRVNIVSNLLRFDSCAFVQGFLF